MPVEPFDHVAEVRGVADAVGGDEQLEAAVELPGRLVDPLRRTHVPRAAPFAAVQRKAVDAVALRQLDLLLVHLQRIAEAGHVVGEHRPAEVRSSRRRRRGDFHNCGNFQQQHQRQRRQSRPGSSHDAVPLHSGFSNTLCTDAIRAATARMLAGGGATCKARQHLSPSARACRPESVRSRLCRRSRGGRP